ncbi:adenylate kinase 7 [Condylostylus longicornis]|uniref:adenylate kinase 7 n=1 Tax=Condylostylus longicornis TaxID=2530218 RepID=UPI00244E123A|nr:adenylate kinase 7 [Condylostylus longicornis]
MLESTSYSGTEISELKFFFNYIDLYQNYAIAKYLINNVTEFGIRFSISGTIYDHESSRISELKKQMSQCLFKTLNEFIDRVIENDYIIYDISSNSKARNNEGCLYESEYSRRRSHSSYTKHKHIEHIVNLFEKKVNGKVRTLIICPGYSFGESNDIFHYIFKLAYLNKQKIPIVEPGNQVIPIIYVKDLARIIGKIIGDFPPSEKKYIFAIQPNFWTIKSFTRAIVNSVAGNVMKVTIMPKNCLMNYEEDLFPQRVIDAITTPLKLVPTYLKDFKYTFTNIEEIGKVLVNEYRIERNLLPIKILIDGPPLSGKSMIAKEIAEYYNLNYFDPMTANTKELIEEWQEYLKDLSNYASIKQKCHEETLKYQIRCIKTIIASKLYSENQGYVIDGFPFTYIQASEIFLHTDFDENEQGKNVETQLYTNEFTEPQSKKFKTSSIMPNFVVFLNISDELVFKRGMELSCKEVLETGNNEENVCQRLEEFRERDEHEDTSLTNFFYDYNVIPQCFAINEDSIYNEIIDAIKIKIGSPHTSKIQAERETKLRQWTHEFEILKHEEDMAAEAKSLPFRQYLAKFVLPTLTEGILEIVRVRPEDPIDYLAEFLFKNNTPGHITSDKHTQEMKKLLLGDENESILSTLDSYILNENEFKCMDSTEER